MIKSQLQEAWPCKTLSRKNCGYTLGIFIQKSAVMFSLSSLPCTHQHFHPVWTLHWSAELQLTPVHFRAIFFCSLLHICPGLHPGQILWFICQSESSFPHAQIPNSCNTYYKHQWFSPGFEKERLTVKFYLLLIGMIVSSDPPSKYQVFAE